MPEYAPQDHEQPIDLDLATHVLGLNLLDTTPTPPNEYDERREIAKRAVTRAYEFRDRMAAIAETQGMAVTDEMLTAWFPDPATTGYLRKELRTERKRLQIIQGISAFNADQDFKSDGLKLRGHQEGALVAYEESLLHKPATPDGSKIDLIKMPTGTGKTGAFAKIAEAAKYLEIPEDPVRVLVLVPTQVLVNQTIGSFGKFAPSLNVGGYYQNLKELESEVVVMCNASFDDLMQKGKMPPGFDLIIVDEAHKSGGPRMGHNLREYSKGKTTVGLSATPDKAYDFFGHPIYNIELPEAVRMGLLAPVRADLLTANPKIDERSLPEDPKERAKALQRAYFEARLMVATPKIIENIQRGVRVVIRCPAGDDIEYARDTAQRLSKELMTIDGGKGIRYVRAVEIGGSKQTSAQRDILLGAYDSGKIDVFTHVKALGMGWDSPYAKAFFNLAPGASADDLIQNLGRVLRLITDEKGKPVVDKQGNPIHAEAYDFVDPYLGDRQYTSLNALRAEAGELITYEPPVRHPEKEQLETDETQEESEKEKSVVEVAVTDVVSELVGQLTISHTVELGQEDDTGTSHIPDNLTFDDACRWFGISKVTMKGIYTQWGIEEGIDLDHETIEIILMANPQLDATPVPKEGFTSISTTMEILDITSKPGVFMRKALAVGIRPHRFRDNEGFIQHYFDEGQISRIKESLKQTKGTAAP